MLQPAVDVASQGNKYVIEAELPGVKKENVNVRIGDGGRSITIEGKVVSRRGDPQFADANATSSKETTAATQPIEGMQHVK